MSVTALLFAFIYLGGICAAIFNPVMGVALYVLVYHLNPETQWWAPSVQTLCTRMSFTVALATFVGMLVRQPRLEHDARQFPTPYKLAILFCVVALGSLAWGLETTDRSYYLAEKLVKLLVFLFILIRCIRTPQHYQLVFYSWLVGILYVGYQAQGGAGYVRLGRLTGGLGGPDFAESSGLAVHLIATLPLIGAAFFMSRTWFGRSFALITGALAVNTLIATRTRNALVGLFVLALAGAFSLPRKYRVRGVLGIVVGGFLAVQLADPGWWHRMDSITNYQSDQSAMSRLTFWRAAWDMVSDHPFGVGLGNFHHVVMDYVPGLEIVRSAHNSVLECLAELGWPGLICYVAVILTTLRMLGQTAHAARELPDFADVVCCRRHTRFHLGWHTMALRTGLLGYLACGMFVTRVFTEDFWLLIGFCLCLRNVSLVMAAEQEVAVQDRLAEGSATAEVLPDLSGEPPGPLPAPNAGPQLF